MLRFIVPAAFSTLLLASPLAAQARDRGDDVPPGHFPPAGMCRVWIDGVPAGQQAAPTDCTTAVRNRPANGRVIFGDDNPKVKRDDRNDDKDADKVAREREKELEKARRDRERALEKERDREKELEKANKDGRIKQLKPKKTTKKSPKIIVPKIPMGI
jgi:hypothetical protein